MTDHADLDAAPRTRFALIGADSQVALAAPHHQTVTEALAAVGIAIDSQRDALVDEDGKAVALDASVSDVADGALLTLVSVRSAPSSSRGTTADDRPMRLDGAAPWWLLGAFCLLLLGAAVSDLALATDHLPRTARLIITIMLGLGSLATGTLWILRARGNGLAGAAAILVPLVMAFVAAAAATPVVYKGAHLAVTIGLLAAAVLATTLAAVAPDRTLRSVATSLVGGLSTLLAVWGITLIVNAPTPAAAIITLGLVAPGLRYIPTTLLKVPDGYSIEYRHFLGNRWSVRGAVPSDPGPVSMTVVKPYVDEATARLTVGVILLSVLGPLTTPFVVSAMRSGSTLESIASTVLLTLSILALILWPRRTTAPVLRWAPRISAFTIALIAVTQVSAGAGDTGRTVLAGALLALALIAAALLVPLSRHRSPLAWSRVGDIFDSLSVLLALPCALLGAGTLEFVRVMVSG